MKATPAPLLAYMQGEVRTDARLWKVQWQNGTILGFTDHDSDIPALGMTFTSMVGFDASDVSSTDTLAVDNLEIKGTLSSSLITQADIDAGLWDQAYVTQYRCNYADLAMGVDYVLTGHLGNVQTSRQGVVNEIRGLTQAMARNIVRLIGPDCQHDFCDTGGIKFGAGCSLNPAAWTTTGTVDTLSADGLTIFDAGRTETGLVVGTGIGYTSDAAGHIAGTTSIPLISGSGTVLAGDVILFSGDTTQYLVKTGVSAPGTIVISPGLVNPLPASAISVSIVSHQYYAGGMVTFTSGLNAGLKMETRTNAAGSFTLALPMPFAIAPGDTYSILAGCDKTKPTCIARGNMVNHGAFVELPGINRVLLAADLTPANSGSGSKI